MADLKRKITTPARSPHGKTRPGNLSLLGLIVVVASVQFVTAAEVEFASSQGTFPLPRVDSTVYYEDGEPDFVVRAQAFGPAILGGFGSALTASPMFGTTGGGSVAFGSASALAIGAESQVRLATVPDVFGDFFWAPTFRADTGVPTYDLPIAGGAGRHKISDHNKAMPVDRVFFNYNHFHNALSTGTLGGGNRLSVDRFILGGEKTFEGGRSSVELRMPLTTDTDFISATGNAVSGGNVGNLYLALKRLFYVDDRTAVAAGAGLELPTGSDANATVGALSFQFENEAVFLSPYLAIERTPNDTVFWNLFSYLDVALNEYGVSSGIVGVPGSASIGDYRPQLMWHLDLSTGVWLYRTPVTGGGRVQGLSGIAAVVELHYAHTLEESSDNLAVVFNPTSFGQARNHLDILNFATGLHFEFNRNTTLRLVGAFPIRQLDDRFFDAEFALQLNRRF